MGDSLRSNPHQALTPSPWVARFASMVSPRGRVLDVACGYGRHARYFAGRGHPVLALDRDAAALATLAGIDGIEVRHVDLEGEPWPLAGQRFAALIVTHYLHRPLFADQLAALQPDGVLLYETFAQGNAAFGKPSRPEFLLAPDELLERAGGRLRVVAFEQGHVEAPFPAVIQRICAVGMERTWPFPLPL